MEKKLLEKKIWAVAGANQNPEKYGNKIYKRLKERGYEVYSTYCFAILNSAPYCATPLHVL